MVDALDGRGLVRLSRRCSAEVDLTDGRRDDRSRDEARRDGATRHGWCLREARIDVRLGYASVRETRQIV